MTIVKPFEFHVLNLSLVSSATWTAHELTVHCGEAEPRKYHGQQAEAVWEAIVGHVSPSPGVVVHAIEGLSEIVRRLDMLEQQTADLDAFDALAARVERLERAAEPDGSRDRRDIAGPAPGPDPDAPRRFRWLKPDGSGERYYGVYCKGTPGTTGYYQTLTPIGSASRYGKPKMTGVEWLDPEPAAKPSPEPAAESLPAGWRRTAHGALVRLTESGPCTVCRQGDSGLFSVVLPDGRHHFDFGLEADAMAAADAIIARPAARTGAVVPRGEDEGHQEGPVS